MKYLYRIFVVLALFGAPAAWADEDEARFLGTNPDMPFSDAVIVDEMLYLSGKIGNVPGTLQLAEGGIQGETRQALENIKASLERYGSSMDRVVKCTVFLADIDEWAAMNEVYVTYFPVNKPARSALGVNGLALDSRVEIECMATVDELEEEAKPEAEEEGKAA